MTVENCLLFDLIDIRNIQFECTHCGARFVSPLDKWQVPPVLCVNCRQPFFEKDTLPHQALRKVQEGIKELLRPDNSRQVVIRFEVKTNELRSTPAPEASISKQWCV